MQELVSVVVTTFNSAKFVIETLESVKRQTWQSIELIVSDDASSDNTVAMASEWIASNGKRFVQTEILTVPVNSGVSANCNRSIAAAKSDWVKFIAGDDVLLPNCIQDNMRYVTDHPGASILFSQVDIYKNDFAESSFLRTVPQKFPFNIMDPSFTASDQFKRLLISDRINFTPSYFFNRHTIVSVGGYDERNRFVEDYPMWLKLTHAGHRLYFLKKRTVGYRQHANATNNRGGSALIMPSVLKSYTFRRKCVLRCLPWDIAWGERISMAIGVLFDSIGWNQNHWVFRGAYLTLTIYLNPFRYISYIKKRLFRVDPVFYGRE